ncbi:hypothetical protein LWI29_001101 [Acer saccharum]|uniref:CCHC-type domain-containing protein n=1 Tax=Acer saccharum TaxID=4024 RepID=A0AA39TKM2_ACESA|nr:hypothetical protein LWI29_001101 [Acer saccharum]
MLLRYESLLDYCFKCGRLGHILDECTKEVNVRDLSSEDNRRLGAWISVVSPPKRPFIGTGRTNKRIWGKLKGFGGSISKYENHRSLQTNWRERTTTCVANDPGGRSKDVDKRRGETVEGGSLAKRNGCMGINKGSLNVPVKNVSREDGK